MLMHVYFWLMLVYVTATLAATPFMAKRSLALAKFSRGAWLDQVASYVLLAVGLLGVYAHLHAVPFFAVQFWQVFLVGFAIFAALQHRMPKTRQLQASHGPKAVVVATIVGVAMLVPMFVAIGLYAFNSPAVWAVA